LMVCCTCVKGVLQGILGNVKGYFKTLQNKYARGVRDVCIRGINGVSRGNREVIKGMSMGYEGGVEEVFRGIEGVSRGY